jgi:drug/metabolite transporter (DMT)-like permease
VGGVLGAAIPSAALLVAVRSIGPTRASILMTLEPVVGAVLAAFLLAERPSPLQIVGGLAVLAAAVLLQVSPPVPQAATHEALERP